MLDEMVRSRQVQDRCGILDLDMADSGASTVPWHSQHRDATLELFWGVRWKMSIEIFLFVLNTFMYMTSCDVIGVLGAV